jgi:hypothetical protein
MEENGSELEEMDGADDEPGNGESSDEDEAILHEKRDTSLPRNNI